MQIINNTGAIIGEQINLGNIDILNIDDLFKDDTNNKKMKNKNYPNWLVPLEIAKELKEIGFDMVCQNWHVYESFISVNFTYLDRYRKNNYDVTTIPTWEQVFEWFRNKGFIITLIDYEDESKFSFYNMKIKGGVHYASTFKTYEEAREALINKLIETYKTNKIL